MKLGIYENKNFQRNNLEQIIPTGTHWEEVIFETVVAEEHYRM